MWARSRKLSFSPSCLFVCNSINLVESGKAESAKLPIPPIKQRAALLEDLIGKRRFWRERKKERDRDRRCLDSRLLFRRFQFLLLLLLLKCWNVWNVFFCWIFFRRVELNLVETFFTLNWRRRRFPHSNLPRNWKRVTLDKNGDLKLLFFGGRLTFSWSHKINVFIRQDSSTKNSCNLVTPESRLKLKIPRRRHSSVYSSAPTILPSSNPLHTIYTCLIYLLSNLCDICLCIVKRTKIKQKRLSLGHILKKPKTDLQLMTLTELKGFRFQTK